MTDRKCDGCGVYADLSDGGLCPACCAASWDAVCICCGCELVGADDDAAALTDGVCAEFWDGNL
jgi:hypothetical protein